MKRNIFYKILGLSLLFVINSCKLEIEAPAVTKGDADFTKYVSLGNSITAGFADGGLYREGQQVAYPILIAEKLKLAGGGDFVSPLFTEAQKNGSGYVSLTSFDEDGNPVLTPVVTQLAIVGMGQDNKTPLYAKFDKSIDQVNNLGIPGLSVATALTAGYGFNNPFGFNPYFERLLGQDNALASYNDVVALAKPTFFTCFLGNNDVLGYATTGGVNDAAITTEDKFKTNYETILETVTAGDAKGLIATVPDVTSLPFFTTVTVDLARQGLKDGAAEKGVDPNTVDLYIKDHDENVRKAESGDLILLTTKAAIGRLDEIAPNVFVPHGANPVNPLTNAEVLDKTEVAKAKTATQTFNGIIKQAGTTMGIPVVDIAATLVQGQTGLVYKGATTGTAFISGGTFSLDGIHLTPRGNAIVANEFIKAINLHYKATIPLIDVNQYRGVKFPN